ncbi:hypothetical protein [Methanolobus sp. ZRKC5]|uniref:hypothetical protein n=1 Tax=Methanolobus sp. ZRKC5 TaxID=3136295 RepID=UPI00313EB147
MEDDNISTPVIVLEDTKFNNNPLDKENPDSDLVDIDIELTTYTSSIKKTGILELGNGYSFKVLNIDKQEKQIIVSLRKDGNEYDTRTMVTGSTYNIKDTKNTNEDFDIPSF